MLQVPMAHRVSDQLPLRPMYHLESSSKPHVQHNFDTLSASALKCSLAHRKYSLGLRKPREDEIAACRHGGGAPHGQRPSHRTCAPGKRGLATVVITLVASEVLGLYLHRRIPSTHSVLQLEGQ